MRYLKVTWRHDLPDEPVALFSELDEANREVRKVEAFADGHYLHLEEQHAREVAVRKVEAFADGHYGFADTVENSVPTVLAELPLPPFDEIASDSQFHPEWITRSDFEKIWHRARLVTMGTSR